MPDRTARTSVNLDVSAGTQPIQGVPEADTPFRILILGDFNGRGLRGKSEPLAGRRPKAVDADNLDQVIASIAPYVELPQGTIRFNALDDFHPDSIYEHTPLFGKLDNLRDQPPPAPASPPQQQQTPQAAKPVAIPTGRSLLESMLDDAEEEPARVVEEHDALADFIKRAVEPHLVARQDPHKAAWAARVDEAAGQQMCEILHHPHFQALESAWRAVGMLVDRLQPDGDLKIYVLDTTLEELMAAETVELERCLGGSKDPWALLVGNFVFGQSARDTARLRWLGRLASVLGAPFLGEAEPPSDTTGNAHWQELVHSAEARWIGLAMPRFLLRLPYGKDTSAAEQLAFEEMPVSVHKHYLWGNPAFFCACLLGLAFRSDGWEINPARHRQIEGLPQHIYREGGESVAKPCAETLLTETEADFILASGLMPLASLKDQDSALLVRLQSIAEPLARLAGRWG